MNLDPAITNYIVLQMLVTESTKLLRKMFLEIYKAVSSSEWNDDEESAKYFKSGFGKVIREKFRKLQQTMIDGGNSNEWDITTLSTILSSNPFVKKLNNRGQHVQKIVGIRNKVSHHSNMNVPDELFEQLSNEISFAMIAIGSTKEDVDKIKNKKSCSIKKFNENEEDAIAKSLLQDGIEAFKIEDYNRAIDLYSKAILLPNLNDEELSTLYNNRSLTYIKIYIKDNDNKDERNIYRALKDAEKACSLTPVWHEGYARLGEIYVILNELQDAKDNYEKALALEPSIEELKNCLADIKAKIAAQIRKDHLDEQNAPASTEESNKAYFKKYLDKLGSTANLNSYYKLVREAKEMIEEDDPTLRDVWMGHEYCHSSDNVTQNYEMAAKYYGKAAKTDNAEGLFNLALLTMNGQGVKQDYKIALALLKQAANQPLTRLLNGIETPNPGVAEAEHAIGLFYQEGIYVIKNIVSATYWYKRAAEHGCPNAANNLGVLYMRGQGLPLDYDQAERFLLLAYKLGSSKAVENLVDLHINQGNPDKALIWHERALESSSLYSKLRDNEIRNEIKTMKEDFEKSEIKDWEIKNCVNSENLSILERFEKFCKFNNLPSFTNFGSKCTSPLFSSTNKYDPNMLLEYAKKGSIFAHNLLDAMISFHEAFEMVVLPRHEFNEEHFITKLYHGYITEQLAYHVEMDEHELILDIVESILAKSNNISKNLDYMARICYAYLICSDLDAAIKFITTTLEKYPNDTKLHHLSGCFYCFLGKFERGVKDFDFILNKEPENYEIFYLKASALRQSCDNSMNKMINQEAIKCYESFLKYALKDNRHVPDAYYAIGTCKILPTGKLKKKKDKNELMSLIKKYYELGLESEKHQLPCFLPNTNDCKEILKMYLRCDTSSDINNNEKIAKPVESTDTINNDMLPSADLNRLQLVKAHREYLIKSKEFLENKGKKTHFQIQTTCKAQFTQTKSPTDNLKKIYLKDINFAKDHVLKGYMIKLRIIDIPIIGVFPSVVFVVEDENKYVERLAIYNLGDNYERIKQKYQIGSYLTIINPYARMAMDGKPTIRVDDPDTVILSNDPAIIDYCQYCGKNGAKFQCSKCLKVKYCNKNCQVNDWNSLLHKSLCKVYALN